MIDVSISFGHYAVPFELCLWLMFLFHSDTKCAIWTMLLMIQFTWTLCRPILNYATYDWWFKFIWTLCRAIWTVLDDSIPFGHYTCAIWSMCTCWTMLMIDDLISFWHYTVLLYGLWLMIHLRLYAVPLELGQLQLSYLHLVDQVHLVIMLWHLNYVRPSPNWWFISDLNL